MNPFIKDNLISTKEASEISGYNSDYLARLCKSKKINGTQIGRTWLVDRASLEDFIATQGLRKIDRARTLARARGKEYRIAQSPMERVNVAPEEPRTLRLPRVTAALAAAASLLIVAASAYAAASGIVPVVAEQLGLAAGTVERGFVPLVETQTSSIAERVDASRTAATQAQVNANETLALAVPQTPLFAGIQLHQPNLALYVPVSNPSVYAFSNAAPAPFAGARLSPHDVAQSTLAFVANAPQAVERAYVGFGGALIGAAHGAIGLDVSLAYATPLAADTSARATLALGGTVDTALARSAAPLPGALYALDEHFTRAGYGAEYALAGQLVGASSGILGTEMSALEGGGALAYASYQGVATGVAALGPPLHALALGAATSVAAITPQPLAAAEDYALGLAGRTALALGRFSSAIGVPELAAVVSSQAPSLSVGGQVALTTYEVLHGIFESGTDELAIIFSPLPTVVGPSSASAPIVTHTSSTPALASTGPTYRSYSTVVQGVSQAYVDQAIADAKSNLLTQMMALTAPLSQGIATNENSIQQVNMIQSLTDLILHSPTIDGAQITSSSFSGSSVSADTANIGSLNVSGDTTLAGNLSIGGSITGSSLNVAGVSSAGAISAPFFTATDTAATSSFAGAFTVAGRVGIGTTSPLVSLAIDGTDALKLPVGTSVQRPLAQNTQIGDIRYNLTTNQFEGYGDNGVWQGLGGVINPAQTSYITADANDFLHFVTAGVEHMTLAPTGNLGIGTTSPYATLSISTSTPYYAGQTLLSIANSASSTLFDVLGNGNAYISGALNVGDATDTLANLGLTPAATSTLASALNIYVWGDSYSFGDQDGSGVTYPNTIAKLTGRAVINEGVPNYHTAQIMNAYLAAPSTFALPFIIEGGWNNITGNQSADEATIDSNIATMVANATSVGNTNYLILGIPTSDGSGSGTWQGATSTQGIEINNINNDLAATYGNATQSGGHFLNQNAWLITNGLSYEGIATSSQSAIDAAAGIPPIQLRSNAAGTGLGPHLNQFGYGAIGYYISQNMSILGSYTGSNPITLNNFPSLYQNNLSVTGSINASQQFDIGGLPWLTGNTINGSMTVGDPSAGLWLDATTTLLNDIAIGSGALSGSVSPATFGIGNNFDDIAIGSLALSQLLEGTQDTAIGYSALANATTTSVSTAVGYEAGFNNISGFGNSLFGAQAGIGLTTGSANEFFGYRAGDRTTTGQSNVAIGANGSGNGSMFSNTTGSFNIAIGSQALGGNVSATTSVAVGTQAGFGNGLSYNNQGGTYIGYEAGNDVATGSDYNTFLGYSAGLDVTSGNDNILIGAERFNGGSHLTTGMNDICIGFNCTLPSGTAAANQLNVGNFIFGTGLTATSSSTSIPTALTGSLGLGTSTPTATLFIQNNYSAGPAFTIASSTNSTGTTASTLFSVLNNGNVGIGTAAPIKTFDVSGNGRFTTGLALSNIAACAGSQALQTDSSGNISCGAISTTGITAAGGWTTNSIGSVTLSTTTDSVGIGATSTPYAKLAVVSTSVGSTTFALVPATGQTANIVDVYNTSGSLMDVFTAAGRLGLGTSTPSTSLDISGTDAIHIPVGNTGQRPSEALTGDIRYNTQTNQFEGYGDNAVWQGLGGVINPAQTSYITADASDFLHFVTASVERMTITNTGNVGIGTTSPSGPLEIYGNDASTNLASGGGVFEAITNANQTAGNFDSLSYREVNSAGSEVTGTRISGVFNSHTAGAESADLAFLTRNAGSLSEKLRITAAGNVGIGTTSPFAALSIAGASNGTTPLFALSTSTASATTTALTVDSNGNLSLLNGSKLSVSGTSLLGGAVTLPGNETVASTSYGTTFTTNAPIPLIDNGGHTYGNDFIQSINMSNDSILASTVAIGTRDDLTITGNASNVAGQDILAGDFATTYGSNGGAALTGTMQTTGGFQAATYVDNAPGATFNYIRDLVLHQENGSADTIVTQTAIQPILTSNLGTIETYIDYTCDNFDSLTGGVINHSYCVYNQDPEKTISTVGPLVLSGASATLTVASTSTFAATSTFQSAAVFADGSTFTSTGLSLGKQILAEGNTGATAPAYSFADAPTDGFYDSSTGSGLNFAISGARVLGLNTSQVFSNNAAGFQIQTANAGVTGSIFIPDRSDTLGGLGATIQGGLSLDVDSGASTTEEMLRLTNAGSDFINGGVGIATSSPYAKLSVVGTNVGSTTLALAAATSQTADILDVYDGGALDDVIGSSGNVGIGSTSPSQPLVVEGNEQLDGLGGNGQGYFATNGSGNQLFSLTRQGTVATGDLSISAYGGIGLTGHIQNNTPAASGFGLYVSNANLVGIGTTSPNTALQVNTPSLSTTNALNGISVSSAGNTASLLYLGLLNTAVGGRPFIQGSSTSAVGSPQDLLLQPYGANVGIGTTTPAASLDVAGNTYLEGTTVQVDPFANTNSNIFFSGSRGDIGYDINSSNLYLQSGSGKGIEFIPNSPTFATANPAGIFTSTGNFGVGTTSPYANLSVMVGGTYASQAASTVFAIGSSTKGSATSTLFTVDSLGQTTINSTGANALTIGPNGITNPAFQINDSAANSGNGLAIITSAPASGVQLNAISSNANESFNIASKGTGGLNLNTSGGGNVTLQTGSTVRVTLLGNISNGGAIGDVGIGTTTPAAMLDVQGNGALAPAIVVANSATYGLLDGTGISRAILGYNSGTTWGSSGGNDLWLRNPAGSNNVYFGNTTPSVTFNLNSGDVGIGTTSPYATLSVMAGGSYASQAASTVFAIGSSTAGTATSTLLTVNSSGQLFLDETAPASPGSALDVHGSTNSTAYLVGTLTALSTAGSTLVVNGTNSPGEALNFNVGGSGTSMPAGTFNGTTGWFGIGTTSPYATLSVMAGNPVSPYASQAASTAFAIGSSTAGTATSTLFSVLSNGNVGIGFKNPSSVLAVNNNSNYGVTGGLELGDGTNNAFLYQSTSAGAFTVQSASTLLLNPSGGSVGIASSTPMEELSLGGSGELQLLGDGGNATSYEGFSGAGGAGGSNGRAWVGYGANYGNSAFLQSTSGTKGLVLIANDATPDDPSASSILFLSGGATGFGVAGGVGIGTTSPATQFVVSNGNTGALFYGVGSPGNGLVISGNGGISNGAPVIITPGTTGTGQPGLSITGFTNGVGQITTSSGAQRTLQIDNTGTGGLTTTFDSSASSGQNFVGIGTTSPYATLSLQAGGGSFASLAPSTVFAIGSTTAGTATSTLFGVVSTGNVFINEASLQNTNDTLEVNGAVDASSFLVNQTNVFGDINGYSYLRGSASQGVALVVNGAAVTTLPNLASAVITPGGNFGIGTTSPYATLSLMAGSTTNPYGAQIASTAFAIGSSTAGTATSTLFQVTSGGQTILSAGSAAAPSLVWPGASNTGLFQASPGNITFAIAGQARVDFASSGNLTGATTHGFTLLAGNNAGATQPTFSPDGQDLKAGIGADKTGDVSIVADNAGAATEMERLTGTSTDFVNGLVGIGTSSPYQALSVVGSIVSTALAGEPNGVVYTDGNGQLNVAPPGSPTSGALCLVANNGGVPAWSSCTSGSGSFDWNQLANPIANLGLSMGAFTTSFTAGNATGVNNPFTFNDTTGNTGTGILVDIASAAGSAITPFQVGALGTPALTVAAGGFVGVGTTTPASPFSIQLNYGTTNNVAFAIGSSTASNGSTALPLFTVANSGGSAVLSNNGGNQITLSSTGTNKETFAIGTGGIGPGALFNGSFQGTTGTSVGVGINPSYSQTSTAGFTTLQIQPTETTLGSGTHKLLQVGTSTAADLFDVLDTGNVGVGTSSPFGLLSIDAASTPQPLTTPLLVLHGQSGQTGDFFDFFNSANTKVFDINASGNVVANAGISAAGNVGSIPSQIQVSTVSGSAGVKVILGAPVQAAKAFTVFNSTNSQQYFDVNSLGQEAIGTTTFSGGPWLAVQAGGTSPFGSQQALFDVASVTSATFATSSVFRINANGNVGIGTTSPASQFVVQGASNNIVFSGSAGGGFSITAGNQSLAGSSGSINLIPGNSVSSNQPALTITGFNNSGVASWSTGSGVLRMLQFSNTGTGGLATIFAGGTGPNYVGIGTTSPLAVLDVAGNAGSTNPLFQLSSVSAGYATTTQLIFTNAGNLGIGTTSPYGKLDLNTPTNQLNAFSIQNSVGTTTLEADTIDTSANIFSVATSTGTDYFDIAADGGIYTDGATGGDQGAGTINATIVYANGVSLTSDERLKTNIQSLGSSSGLALIDQLNPVSFNWINPAMGTTTNLGFIAQQVQAIAPELVNVSSDASSTLSLNYIGLVAPAVEAIQQLNARTSAISNAATSTQLSIAAGGNVGIGTITPAAKLQVAGNVLASEYDVAPGPIAAYSDTYGTSTVLAQIPASTLTASGQVNLYALASYNLSGITTLAARIQSDEMRLTSLEARVAALESGAVSVQSSSPFSTSTLASAFSAMGAYISDGLAQFGTLVADQFVAATNSAGTSSAGSGTIAIGSTTALVANAYVHPSSKIFVTFTSAVPGSWYLSNKQDGSFQVTLNATSTSAVSFDYFIVETEGQVATSTAPTVSGTPAPGDSNSAPVITMLGANPVVLTVGDAYADPGEQVSDATDGTDPLSYFVNGVQVTNLASTIDTSSSNQYIITYTATDSQGNTSSVHRVVDVNAVPGSGSGSSGSGSGSTPSAAPTVTLNGSAAMQITQQATSTPAWSDPGATAVDASGTDISGTIVVTGGPVDPTTVGTYTLTYAATDSSGNTGSAERTVVVVASSTPE